MKINKVTNAVLLTMFCTNIAMAQSFFTIGTGTNSPIYTLFADTSTNILYAGGLFSQAGNVQSYCIATWNGVDWDSTRNQFINPGTSQIRGINKINNNIYVGGILGVFDTLGNQIGYGFSKWNAVYNFWDSCGGYADGVIQGLYEYNGEIYVSGNFDSIGGMYSSKIARYDGTSWYAFPPLDTNGGGWTILNAMFYNGDLYVGGNFVSQLGFNMEDIAKWDGSQWLPVGNGLSGSATNARAFAIYQGKLIVGGYFKVAWGDPGNNVAAWDGSQWTQLGAGTDGEIRCLTVYHGELWAGGGFFNAGGVPVSYLAKWDGTQWYNVGVALNNVVTSMAVLGNDLYIGGGFVTVLNGDTANYIMRYNDATGFEALVKDEQAFCVSPNPAKENLTINYSLPENINNGEILLTDLMGRELLQQKIIGSQKNIQLNIEKLAAGNYFVALINNQRKKVVRKFVKE